MSAVGRSGLRSTKAFAVVIVAILLLGGWVTVRSPVFAVRDVLVVGHASIPRAEVVRLSGVRPGDNLLLEVSAGEVRERLEANPWIADAEVERRLPSTVVLAVRERVAAGWVEDPAGGAVVAGDGTVLERPGRRPAGLPLVGSSARALPSGARVSGMSRILEVAASFRGALLPRVAAVRDGGSDLTLALRGGGRVLYGPPSAVAAKNAAVLSMLSWAAERGVRIAYLDVRVPDAPVLRATGRG